MEIIAISNQKGGVGKSTSANALGAGLHAKGYRVLYVDMDAQGNLSYSMGAINKALSSLEVLTGSASALEAITPTAQGDLIPASAALASADLILKDIGKEYRLREALEQVSDKYDYVILDCPPALGILTVNALTAADSVIIPTQADVFSLQGIGAMYQTIQTVRKYCNKDLSVKGLLVTRYNARAILSRDMSELLASTAAQLDTKVFKTPVRECIALKEAQAKQQSIFRYAAKSNAAEDYSALIDEILQG